MYVADADVGHDRPDDVDGLFLLCVQLEWCLGDRPKTNTLVVQYNARLLYTCACILTAGGGIAE